MLIFLGLNRPELITSEVIFYYGLGGGLAAAGLLTLSAPFRRSDLAKDILAKESRIWRVLAIQFGASAIMIAAVTGYAKITFEFHPMTTGIFGSCLALFSLFATAMMFTRARHVPRWRMILTPLIFIASALTAGALLTAQVIYASVFLVALFALQCFYMLWGDRLVARKSKNRNWNGTFLLNDPIMLWSRSHRRIMRPAAIAFLSVIPIPLFLFMPLSYELIYAVFGIHLVGQILTRLLFLAETEYMEVEAELAS